MIKRDSQTLTWDHENRLASVSGGATESYLYDADGMRVKKTSDGVETYYPFPHYELHDGVVVKYYFFNGMRVAQRRGSSPITYLHGNHLGSTVLETSVIGVSVNDEKYFAYGEQRDTGPVNTENQYTDQKRDDTGLYYYGARYYDPALGTFVSPDSIVPEPTNVFDYNRMMYTRGNPLKFSDPSGNCSAPEAGSGFIVCIDFFIQTEKILSGGGDGDGRGFDADSDPLKSRAYFYLHFDADGVLTKVTPNVNESCTIAGCYMAADVHNVFNATQDRKTGEIFVDWHLTNGVSSFFLSESEELMEAESEVERKDAASGLIYEGVGALNVAGLAIPAINGEMVLTPNKRGSFDLAYLNRDPYPSLEIYGYTNGNLVDTIKTLPERSFPLNFGPVFWLSPLAPNQRLGPQLAR